MKLKVRRSIRQSNGSRVILFSWGLSTAHKNENVVCVADDGSTRWRAALPETVHASDCFVRLRAVDDHVVAETYSGFEIYIDPESGRRLAIRRAA